MLLTFRLMCSLFDILKQKKFYTQGWEPAGKNPALGCLFYLELQWALCTSTLAPTVLSHPYISVTPSHVLYSLT